MSHDQRFTGLLLNQSDAAAVIQAGVDGLHKLPVSQRERVMNVISGLAWQLLRQHQRIAEDHQNDSLFCIESHPVRPLKAFSDDEILGQ